MRAIRSIVIATATPLVVGGASTVAPLPSWNDGAAKTAILAGMKDDRGRVFSFSA